MFLHTKWCSMYLPESYPYKKGTVCPQNWNWTWIQWTEKHQNDENVNVCHTGKMPVAPCRWLWKECDSLRQNSQSHESFGRNCGGLEWEETEIFEQKRGKWLYGELKKKRLNEMFLFIYLQKMNFLAQAIKYGSVLWFSPSERATMIFTLTLIGVFGLFGRQASSKAPKACDIKLVESLERNHDLRFVVHRDSTEEMKSRCLGKTGVQVVALPPQLFPRSRTDLRRECSTSLGRLRLLNQPHNRSWLIHLRLWSNNLMLQKRRLRRITKAREQANNDIKEIAETAVADTLGASSHTSSDVLRPAVVAAAGLITSTWSAWGPRRWGTDWWLTCSCQPQKHCGLVRSSCFRWFVGKSARTVQRNHREDCATWFYQEVKHSRRIRSVLLEISGPRSTVPWPLEQILVRGRKIPPQFEPLVALLWISQTQEA